MMWMGYRMAMFWVEHVARLKGSLSHASYGGVGRVRIGDRYQRYYV